MSKLAAFILAGFAFALGMGVGVLGYLQATGGDGEASQDVGEVVATLSLSDATPTLSVNSLSTQVAELSALNQEQANQIATLSAGSAATADAPTPAPTEATAADSSPADSTPTDSPPTDSGATAPDEAANTSGAERALFRIVTEESEARFRINEILAGVDTEVVGVTQQVAGDIIINYQNPSLSQVGEIAVNVRTIRTDNDFRNQAIRSRILQSGTDEFEFVRFMPTELLNLGNGPVEVTETITFQIVGDLSIKGTTRSVTFDATVTAVTRDRIEGFATTTILYQDFGLNINPPPQVAGVEDSVILEIDFVAQRVDES